MHLSVEFLAIRFLELVFHVDGNNFLLGGDCLRGKMPRDFGDRCCLRLTHASLTVRIVCAWHLNFIGNDRTDIPDNRRAVVVQIDIHIVIQLSKVVIFA